MYINMKKLVEMLDNADRRELLEMLSKPGTIKDPEEPTKEEIDLLNVGKKLQAVKAYRNRTGTTLNEAYRVISARTTKCGEEK